MTDGLGTRALGPRDSLCDHAKTATWETGKVTLYNLDPRMSGVGAANLSTPGKFVRFVVRPRKIVKDQPTAQVPNSFSDKRGSRLVL